MNIRYPVQAGAFYESSAASCRHHAQKLINQAVVPNDLDDRLFGGIVPHAGWVYSGPLAAQVFKALTRERVRTIVLLGTDHVGVAEVGEVYDSGVWRTPLGDATVDSELAKELVQAAGDVLRSNPQAHSREHSIEVQVPIVQVSAPSAGIVPITVPPTPMAVEIGLGIGKALAGMEDVKVVASSDMTHHGGGRFPSPGGRGAAGEEWARGNDRRLLDIIERLDAAEIVPEAHEHQNSCGAGAIAAAIGACKRMGATRSVLLDYTTSYEVMHRLYPDDPDDTTVGYASVVFA